MPEKGAVFGKSAGWERPHRFDPTGVTTGFPVGWKRQPWFDLVAAEHKAVRDVRLDCRLVQFRLNDPEPLIYHGEPILPDGAICGYLSFANYGHHLRAGIGLGYVHVRDGENVEQMLESDYAIEIAGEPVAVTASLKPLYDPGADRVRA